jgi:phenylacetate-CoA ligase
MQWWQFRFTPMRSVILAKVSVLKIAWGAWRFARGDGNAIACRQRARLQDLVRYARSASPYYRLRYRHLPPGEVDLQSLPPVTKRDLMEHFDEWVTDPDITPATGAGPGSVSG